MLTSLAIGDIAEIKVNKVLVRQKNKAGNNPAFSAITV
ncbi:hypothetical protein GXM_02839 [Nostoc sphaeroides CCNUC1]|uniref:Uncharacterized protein n=1 Tax=Nostoc sphaeroides CCNUC1 TaxID=2653204 RepID=A0A5P8VY61_9NOSO|nr:hypothetical protein GXM_02839 [Nostoc sphaeroides CCNUC1]